MELLFTKHVCLASPDDDILLSKLIPKDYVLPEWVRTSLSVVPTLQNFAKLAGGNLSLSTFSFLYPEFYWAVFLFPKEWYFKKLYIMDPISELSVKCIAHIFFTFSF